MGLHFKSTEMMREYGNNQVGVRCQQDFDFENLSLHPKLTYQELGPYQRTGELPQAVIKKGEEITGESGAWFTEEMTLRTTPGLNWS